MYTNRMCVCVDVQYETCHDMPGEHRPTSLTGLPRPVLLTKWSKSSCTLETWQVGSWKDLVTDCPKMYPHVFNNGMLMILSKIGHAKLLK